MASELLSSAGETSSFLPISWFGAAGGIAAQVLLRSNFSCWDREEQMMIAECLVIAFHGVQ